MRRRSVVFITALLCASAPAAASAQKSPPAPPPAPAAAPPAPERTSSTYGDWVVRCEARPAPAPATAPPGRQCELAQTVLDARQQPVLQIVIGTPAQMTTRVLIVQIPLNIFVPGEARLMLEDKDKPVPVGIKTCLPRGCFAETDLTDALAARLRAMGDAPAHFDYKDAAQAQVSVPVSLKGFATALDALARERS